MKKNNNIKFGMVKSNVLRDNQISLKAKGLYAYLSVFADNVDKELFVGVRTMCVETDMSISTIKRLLDELQKKNVIVRYYNGVNNVKITKILK